MTCVGGSERLNDLWRYCGEEWQEMSPTSSDQPAPRSDAVSFYDSKNHAFVVHGGRTDDGLSDETWTFSNNSWTLAAVTGPTSAHPYLLGI